MEQLAFDAGNLPGIVFGFAVVIDFVNDGEDFGIGEHGTKCRPDGP
jgi:hypothetical protein